MTVSSPNALITVIMPAYNAEAFLSPAIDSVLAQTHANWELIIVNDGSIDGTLAIAQSYAEKNSRIKVFNQENQGVSTARNVGIDNAKGSYIAFLDSDDTLRPNFLEELYSVSSTHGCDITYCGVEHEKDGKIQGEPYPEGNMLLSYAHGIVEYIGFSSMLIRLDFLNQHNIRFNPICSVGEDQEFVIHCGVYASVKSVPKVLYIYRWNQESVISTMTPAKVQIDLESRQRSTQLVKDFYKGPEKQKIIKFLESWEDRIVIIFTNIVVQEVKKGELERATQEVKAFGLIPYCWRSKSIKHFRRAFILNNFQPERWAKLWQK